MVCPDLMIVHRMAVCGHLAFTIANDIIESNIIIFVVSVFSVESEPASLIPYREVSSGKQDFLKS